jgi:putative transcriptional regulator
MIEPKRPSDEVLAEFTAGRLDEGLSLVVAAHVETNRQTALDFALMRSASGVLLDTVEPEPMARSGKEAALALPAIDAARPAEARPVEGALPRVLAPYQLGRWQPIGWGIALRRVEVPGAEARVFMLRARPGIALPAHRHTGREWTAILSGAYEHQYGRYEAGSFDEADERHTHAPQVDPVEGCTCIVALTGEVRFESWLGRLIQPLVRL